LRALGWQVEAVPWRRRGGDWARFDAAVIRSTWDYQQAPDDFLAVLADIDQSGIRLENALDLVRWNLRKTYLRDLGHRGVPVVPTAWGSDLGPVEERTILDRLGTDEVVLKPVVGANADHTYRLGRGAAAWGEAAATLAHRPYMAQPFVPSVVSEGEFSLFFFDGQYSHAVVKTPAPGDFRVQEEHGGIIRPVLATDALISTGERALTAVGQVPLYARVDLVRMPEGQFALMELELIEPSLYLRMSPEAPERFARACDRRFRRPS
jgi:glutathione synthase/RimK-type ligase-like ATP-grasp enzyme